jgi:hypothetical protein
MNPTLRIFPNGFVMGGVVLALLIATVIVPATGIFRLPELPPSQTAAVRDTVLSIREMGTEVSDRGEFHRQVMDVRSSEGDVK